MQVPKSSARGSIPHANPISEDTLLLNSKRDNFRINLALALSLSSFLLSFGERILQNVQNRVSFASAVRVAECQGYADPEREAYVESSLDMGLKPHCKRKHVKKENPDSDSLMRSGAVQFKRPQVVDRFKEIVNILESIVGETSYRPDDGRIAQLVDMGRIVIPDLLTQLNSEEYSGNKNWVVRSHIENALMQLLTEDDENLILQEFEENGHFSELILSHRFDAAEDMLMERIAEDWKMNDDLAMEAAMILNEERAVPLLKEHIMRGKNIERAFLLLEEAGVGDLDEVLEGLWGTLSNPNDKAFVAQALLGRGNKQGFELAIHILGDPSFMEHYKFKLAKSIAIMTYQRGSTDELLAFLVENLECLKWDAGTQIWGCF